MINNRGVTMLNNAKALFLPAMLALLASGAHAQKFSNSSLDGQFGGDSVSGTFIDQTGATGGAVEGATSSLIGMVVAVCVLVGFILAAKSLYDMYSVSANSQNGQGYTRPLVTLVIGCALAILPTVAFFSANTIRSMSS